MNRLGNCCLKIMRSMLDMPGFTQESMQNQSPNSKVELYLNQRLL
uniref:Uncharacterized protein n=1 Tax=Lotus japonicus TaxID=34305 RepID=I3T8Q8_LOTJA|nr:unknown [Lotus japonicus]